MTRENAKALLPIIKAYAEGKVIQMINPSGEWIDHNEPLFNCDYSFYRIKQKVKFRPFANAEECWQKMQKHQPFGWVKSTLFKDLDLVKRVTTLYIEINREIIDYKDALEKFTFADNTNFGVKVEE